MSVVDIIILVVLGLFFLIGLVRGLIHQVGSIIGFFLSLWIAQHYYPQAAAMLKPSLGQWPLIATPLSIAVGYIGLYFLVSFLFSLLVKLLDHSIKLFSLFPLILAVNRFGGALIGLIEGLLLLSVVLYVVSAIPTKNVTEVLEKSKLTPIVRWFSKLVQPFLPTMPSLDLRAIDPSVFNLNELRLDESELKAFKQEDFSSVENMLKRWEEIQKSQKKQ